MTDFDIKLDVPLKFRRGTLRTDQHESIRSGRDILLYAETLVEGTLADKDILDFGCGVKFSQALLQFGIAIRSYTGLDVYKGMIEYMQGAVQDPRFEFHTVEFQNDMYNKNGQVMNEFSDLPVGEKKFDLITMQSVITHFNPSDSLTIFKIFKRYLKPNGEIFFTVRIDDNMEGDFLDVNPERPLLHAIYKKEAMDKILDQAGFKTKSFHGVNNKVRVQAHYVVHL